MALKLYNTLSRKKEVFKPLKNKKVGLILVDQPFTGMPILGI